MEKIGMKVLRKVGVLRRAIAKINNFVGGKRFDLLIFIPIFLYAIIFSYHTLLKHYTFNSHTWDLGIFNQALYTTLYHGKLLFTTAELFMNTSGSYMAVHFSPILFILLPFYAIHPSAETLLVIKSFVLALGALPLYFLTKETLKSRKAAFALSIAYLLHPAIQGSNWFDFQQQIFIPVLLFSSAYFMVKEKWKAYFVSVILSLMISEQTTLAVLALSIYYLLTSDLRKILSPPRRLKITRGTALLLTVLLCLAFFCLAEYIKGLFPIRQEFVDVYRAKKVYEVLGFEGNSLLSLPAYVVLNPGKLLSALLYDYPLKLMYIVFLFAPLAFQPFGSKMSIVIFILLMPFLVSNYPAYYMIGTHYPLYIIAHIFLAALETMSKRTKKDVNDTLRVVMVSSLIFIVSLSPVSPISQYFVKADMLWYPPSNPMTNNEIESMHRMLESIPRSASVLTQDRIFPHLSSRINAYVLPHIVTNINLETLKEYVRDLMNRSEYILLDISQRDYWTQFAINEIVGSDVFSPYKFMKYTILFKKNYTGPAQLIYFGNETEFSAQDFYLNLGRVINDETAGGPLAFCPKGSKRGVFIFGPYVFLPRGVYNVTWVVKADQYNEGYLAAFEVTEKFGEAYLSRRDLYGFDIEPNTWSNVTVTFTLNRTKSYVEFRVYSTGTADIYVDRVILKQISGEVDDDHIVRTFNYRELKFNGRVTDEGFLIYSAKSGDDAWSFWFGPYISMSPGKYRVTFNIKVEPYPETDDEIIKLEIAKKHGEDLIANLSINRESISDSGWSKITLEFTLENPTEDVEFRGVNPSREHDIYLAYILLEKVG